VNIVDAKEELFKDYGSMLDKFYPSFMLIPQVRSVHKYPISPWEIIHPPGGDNPVCM
jgi:hypothetical protein